jgi:hypothetical protein
LLHLALQNQKDDLFFIIVPISCGQIKNAILNLPFLNFWGGFFVSIAFFS